MRTLSATLAIALSVALPVGARTSSRPGRTSSTREASPDPADSLLWMEMRNVDLHIDAEHVMHMRVLRGEVIPAVPAAIPFLDDPKTFHLRVTKGIVALGGGAIAALLNTIAFNYANAPIKHLEVRIEKGQLVQKGTLRKGVDLPFEMWATPVLQADGRLRLHPSKLRIFSVNGLTLMHALGLRMEKLMDLRNAHGVTVNGDDLLIDPLQLIPPPTVSGRLASVRIEDSLLVQEFARTPDDTIFGTYVRPDSSARNFVYFRGGALRFGKLTMHDTDLLIGDDDERDPLDLYLAQYNKQLVAGRARNLPNLGLRTWLVDYRRVVNRRSATKLYRTTPLRGLYRPPQLQGPYFYDGSGTDLKVLLLLGEALEAPTAVSMAKVSGERGCQQTSFLLRPPGLMEDLAGSGALPRELKVGDR